MTGKLTLILAALWLGLAMPAWTLDFWSDLPDGELATKLAAAMSDEELAGQVLMLGFPGEVPTPAILSWASDRNLGSVKLFGYNANSLSLVIQAVNLLQRASQRSPWRIPLLIGTDQEGGWVRHVRGATSQTPGNLAIGSSGLPYDAMKTGYFIGDELRSLGINMNLAPTVDIYTNKEAHVIGPRAFSSDPYQTALLAMAFYRGQEQTGVISTAKHFPGHGNASEDSHGSLPEIGDNLDTLLGRELVPYHYLIKENLPAIMTGHLSFPKITGHPEPASLSPFFIGELLRQRLGFGGLVVTDDIFMEGARAGGLSYPQAVEKALRAGNDLIMLSQPVAVQPEVAQHLARLAQKEPAFRSRLQNAVWHVLMAKLRYLKRPGGVPLYPSEANLANIPNREGRSFFLAQAARSVAAVKPSRLPLPKNQLQNLLVVTPYDGFFAAMAARFAGAKVLTYGYNPFFGFEAEIKAKLLAQAAGASQIVFNLVTPGSVNLLKVLEPWKDKLTVVSMLTPIYLRETPWIESAVAVYGANRDSFEAGAAVLAGDFVPKGRVPLEMGP